MSGDEVGQRRGRSQLVRHVPLSHTGAVLVPIRAQHGAGFLTEPVRAVLGTSFAPRRGSVHVHVHVHVCSVDGAENVHGRRSSLGPREIPCEIPCKVPCKDAHGGTSSLRSHILAFHTLVVHTLAIQALGLDPRELTSISHPLLLGHTRRRGRGLLVGLMVGALRPAEASSWAHAPLGVVRVLGERDAAVIERLDHRLNAGRKIGIARLEVRVS